MSAFMDAVLKRRTRYALSDEMPMPDAKLEAMLRELLKNTPTAFNMQNTRMVLLLAGAHKALWGIVMDTLRERVPPDKFPTTEAKINAFAAAHGSILFFDDTAVTGKYQAEYPSFAENFDMWTLQQNGMLQFAAWTLLAEQGIGASLQHYNPIIDDAVKEKWQLPAKWRLLAQMPFGVATAPDDEKDFEPLDQRFLTFI